MSKLILYRTVTSIMVSQESLDKLAFGRKYGIIRHEEIKNKNNVSVAKTMRMQCLATLTLSL